MALCSPVATATSATDCWRQDIHCVVSGIESSTQYNKNTWELPPSSLLGTWEPSTSSLVGKSRPLIGTSCQ